MADTVTVFNGNAGGTNYTVATDDISVGGTIAGHVQFVKLVDGTLNGTNIVPADSSTTSNRGLYVESHTRMSAIIVASGGLTTATTAYVTGDQLGTQFTVANAARYTGGTGTIVGVSVLDKSDVVGALDVVFTRASVTLAGDNAAYAISDADALNVVEVVQLGGAVDLGNNRFARAMGLSIPFDTGAGTSLYAGLITRSGHTFFGAVGDLQLTVYVIQD